MSNVAEQLDKCAQEQVQLIGHIQPHGLLFALTEPDLIVLYVSSNVDSLLGIPVAKLIGQSIEAILGAQQVEGLRAQLSTDEPSALWSVKLQVSGTWLNLDCAAHRQGGAVLLEVELPLTQGPLVAFDVGIHFSIPLLSLEEAKDIAQLSRLATNEIRRLTGFDRVMAYRFDEEWNGQVIAEAKGSSGISYSGLRFPASDIPPQVRALFLINRVRAIADVDASPVPIVPEAKSARALDLTRSLLRSAAPIHLEYLRNMRVAATLTFSIVVKGRLWGMFACHHPTPYRVDRSTRSASELIAQIFASQLALRLDNAELERSLAGRSLLENFMADLALSIVGSDPRHNLQLLSLLDADGMLTSINGVISSAGVTADEESLLSVARQMKAIAVQGIASSHSLSELDSTAVSYASEASGALYIELVNKDDFLLFLRRELIESVIWAGNPKKSVQSDQHDRLHPRLSFEAWREMLRGRSRLWSANELQMAALLRDRLDRRDRARTLDILTARFNMATRAARVGVFERDANWEIVWWSEVMWEVFGQDPVTFRPSNESWLALVHPDDRERMREEVAHLAQSQTAFNFQYRVIRPDGELRHIRSIGAPEDLQDGVVNRFAGITIDVTERIQAEEREQALQQQLRERSHQAGMAEVATGVLHNVGNVLNSLGIANSMLRRHLKALRLDRLEQTSSLIHDNRATLATFLAEDERGRHLTDYLKALSAQLASDVGSARAEVETVEQLLQHLRDVVSAQQAYAKIGGLFETVSLRELAELALLVLAPTPASFNLVKLYEDVPAVTTDRHKLLQILVNLISNAWDAVRVEVAAPHRIVVRIYRDADHAVVSVEDSGVGMSKEVMSRLWQLGFSTKRDGYGFGLHNSANAAREIGATITAHSDGAGKGSCFMVRLPLDDNAR